MKRPQGVCKDCWADYQIQLEVDASTKQPRWRPAPEPGPRCVSHARAAKARRSARTHALKVESGFGIPAEVYWALYEFQGGRCAVLNCRATGKTRRLAVDHDHKCCPGRTSCGKCVRGLLCNPHNEMFGRNGDDPAVFRSMAEYLEIPTYRRYQWRGVDPYTGLCSEGCELRGFRHAHGTTLFQPEAAHLKERSSEDTEEARP